MAISVARTTTTPARGTSTSSQAGSFASLPAAGSAVVVYGWGWGGVIAGNNPTCADNQGVGNTYALDAVHLIANGQWCAIFRASNIGTTSGTFTVTVTKGSSWVALTMTVVAVEVTGLVSASPLDGTPTTATGTGTAATPGSLTTTNANDYLATVAVSDAAGTTADVTKPTNFTSRYIETDGGTYEKGGGADEIVSATGAYNPSWTFPSAIWSCCLAAYKGSAAAAAPRGGWAAEFPAAAGGGVVPVPY